MSAFVIIIVALAAGIAVFLMFRALRSGGVAAPSNPETLLLEEAIVTEPVAPGMEGKAEIRRQGSGTLALRIRATDESQAFARGAKVRVIDFREGCCYIESSDEEHLVR